MNGLIAFPVQVWTGLVVLHLLLDMPHDVDFVYFAVSHTGD